jgi:hypothetical protein
MVGDTTLDHSENIFQVSTTLELSEKFSCFHSLNFRVLFFQSKKMEPVKLVKMAQAQRKKSRSPE